MAARETGVLDSSNASSAETIQPCSSHIGIPQ